MKSSRFFYGLIAAIFLFCTSLHGGELEKLSRELDYLEENFWTMASVSEDNNLRSNYFYRLKIFYANIAYLHRRLMRQGIRGSEVMLKSSHTLVDVFNTVRPSQFPNRQLFIKGTDMSEYRKIFLRNQRYMRKKGKKQNLPTYPTLRNINKDNYKMWVERTCRKNSFKVRIYAKQQRRKKNKKFYNHGLIQKIDSFALAITKLRCGLVDIAQNPSYKEK